MDTNDATRDDRAIRNIIESWYRAMEEGDVVGLLSLVTNDVIVKAPGSEPISGKSQLERVLSAFLQTHSETVDFEVDEVETSGQLAFAGISESATIQPRSGANSTIVNGMHLMILRRQPDGEWLIARDISSLLDAP